MADRRRQGTEPDHDTSSLSFGLERLGLVPLRFPVLTALFVLALSVLAALGLTRLQVDDSLSELFRSDTEEFRTYERLAARFPSSEYDVLIVIEGENILTNDNLTTLSDLMLDLNLNFTGTMTGLVSLFSAREPLKDGVIPPPLFPAELPEGAAFDKLMERVRKNPIIKGKLLSDDGTLTLVVMALDRKAVAEQGLKKIIHDIRSTVDDVLDGSGLTAKLSGAPVMQLEIRNAVERDQLVYSSLGFVIGLAIALLFLRRLSLVAIAVIPPILAVLWSLGALGWIGFKLNLFLNIMSPLIMVIALSDSMQITMAMRERLRRGDPPREAMRFAVLVVVPAALLTLATTAASFMALLISASALIATFGKAGVLSTLLANLAVIIVLPLLPLLLLRQQRHALKEPGRNDIPGSETAAMAWLRAGISGTTKVVLAAPKAFTALSLIAVIWLASLHFSLQPKYRLADQVPDREQALAANASLDKKLTGAKPVHVLIDFPQGATLYDTKTLDIIRRVHAVLISEAGLGNVWSVETLRQWLRKSGDDSPQVLKQYVDMLPAFLTRRFISVKEDAVVVTGRIPDLDAADLKPILDSIEQKLAPIRADARGYRITVTGLAAIAARNSGRMIAQLNWGLVAEMFIVSALVGLAFRTPVMGVLAILPGFFPVFAAGAFLALRGEGMQFASIVALIVAFGLGLSATIHYLNRLRQEARPGRLPRDVIYDTTMRVGPALFLTAIVLACGMGITVFSGLPSLRLFGTLSAITLLAALIGTLIILPATAYLAQSYFGKRR